MTRIFNVDWNVVPVGDSNSRFYMCGNSKYGHLYATETMISRLEIADLRLLSLLYEYHLKGNKVLLVEDPSVVSKYVDTNKFSIKTEEQLLQTFPYNHKEKQLRILLNMFRFNGQLGAHLDGYDFDPVKHFVDNDIAMVYLLDLMVRKGLIQLGVHYSVKGEPTLSGPLKIEEAGWEVIDEIIQPDNSKKVFVAMWFDESMNEAYRAIESAVADSGYTAIRVDRTEHNNEISSEILYDIKQSKFVVADVTGQRHGVYYEAGYAIGQGIPVIWCCRYDDLHNVHFDTRQYNHIVWNEATDLKQRMVRRIKGTILMED